MTCFLSFSLLPIHLLICHRGHLNRFCNLYLAVVGNLQLSNLTVIQKIWHFQELCSPKKMKKKEFVSLKLSDFSWNEEQKFIIVSILRYSSKRINTFCSRSNNHNFGENTLVLLISEKTQLFRETVSFRIHFFPLHSHLFLDARYETQNQVIL